MGDWPEAVLFDFDGVIVNSEPVHLRAFQHAARALGIELSDEEYYRELIGFDDAGAWRRLFALHGRPLDEQALARVMRTKFDAMRELLETRQVPALPGVREFVEALAAHGKAMAVCSGAVRGEIEPMLRGVRLAQHFPVITAAEDVAVGKPDPGGYLLTVRRVSEMIGRALRPQDCLVVEDAPLVVRSVRGVGFRALGVATSCPASALDGADWVVRSLRREELTAAAPELGYLFDRTTEDE